MPRPVRLFLLGLCALLLGAVPAAAATAAVAPICHAYSGRDITAESAGTLDWTCTDDHWRDGQPITWLRFSGWNDRAPPRAFSSRITVFDSVTITAVSEDGTLRKRRYLMDEARPIVAGAVFTLPLPTARSDTVAYLVRIEGPHSVTVASEARIAADPQAYGTQLGPIMLLSLVAGMMLMPLLFDASFYIANRERFVLLHGSVIVCMLLYLLFSGGLVSAFATIPVQVLAIGGPLSWCVGSGLAGFFMAAFLEPMALPRRLRQALVVSAWWCIAVPGFCSLQLPATQPFDNQLYFLGFLPVIAMYGLVIVVALLRGSLPARFLLMAWVPVILTATERLLRGMGFYSADSSVDDLLFLAIGAEAVIFTLGVVHRFIALHRERDQAIGEARTLEELSERDPLTGLLNRRALSDRFATLRREGFVSLALIDLDGFKGVNDHYGHQMGDRVLRAVARTLVGDSEIRAFRFGGEEFLLLLRGQDAAKRAEWTRQAIPLRVAKEVPGLDRVVTASVGMLEMSADALPDDADFEELYVRADQLLYEAKFSGRNRIISEKLRAERRRRGVRRKEAA
ncbi:sensor domain-containing diguanylate cyclase [Altererythrobacter sp. B11]|uniref:sensor domain-containing diguanylate cyclase n=1 Tax=Altererythrobacter sp. B11 TaxID=2060312 RepID=UPI001E52CDCC|nr:diguanylate cyclase [Altererythrobacter sp. B11]